MYAQITTLGKQAVQDLNQITSRGINRDKIFAIALAYSIASKLDVPAQSVESALDYFRMQSEREVMSTISAINELAPCEVSTALDHVKRFFSFRVDVSFNKSIPVIPVECSLPMMPFMALFRVSNYFPIETIELINRETPKFIIAMGLLQNILRDLTKKETSNLTDGYTPTVSVYDQK